MLFSKKILAFAVGLGSLVLANAISPMQVSLKHKEYETQGYRILQNKNVQGYSVRIKQPKSCEEGVQVKKKEIIPFWRVFFLFVRYIVFRIH